MAKEKKQYFYLLVSKINLNNYTLGVCTVLKCIKVLTGYWRGLISGAVWSSLVFMMLLLLSGSSEISWGLKKRSASNVVYVYISLCFLQEQFTLRTHFISLDFPFQFSAQVLYFFLICELCLVLFFLMLNTKKLNFGQK